MMQIKNLTFDGEITGASYVVMTDNNSTEADREVWAYWFLGAVRGVAASESLVIANLEFNLLEED